MKKVLILIVCYQAERFIEGVLQRIPDAVWAKEAFETEILIIDDQSADRTFYTAHAYTEQQSHRRITVLRNPVNQGYGGNQKIGYHYAIEHGFDVVVLLHGDGQYPPEYIVPMVEPILNDDADVVLGSRMMNKLDALRGRMPLYKWLGNQFITGLQNLMLHSRLSEFHTGFRAYSVRALARVPFDLNSDYYDFDTDIIIQMLDTEQRILEIPVPTFYGDEICYVNGFRYAALILHTTLLSRIIKLGIFYHPKFDYETGNTRYIGKFGYPSSHQFALDRVSQGQTVLDIGCGPGLMAQALAAHNVGTVSIDVKIQPLVRAFSREVIEADLDSYDFSTQQTPVQVILLLDVIEHLKSPESLIRRLRAAYASRAPRVIVTTGNVAFLPLRIALLCGMFNYGRRGILDLDHTRLFTFGSLRRLLETHGYEILEVKGIPPPFPVSLGDTPLARALLFLNRVFIRLWRTLFAYQIAIVARPRPTLSQLLSEAHRERDRLLRSEL